MDQVEQIKKQEQEERTRPFIAVRDFWTDHVVKDDGSIKSEDFVSWVKKGQTIQDEMRSKIKFMPKYYVLEWRVLEPYYKAWKDGQEKPIDGTPLDTWPGATKQLVKVLSQVNIRSVDDFCDMEDSSVSKLAFPGIREMQRKCRMFREAQKNMGPQVAKLAKLEDENAFLRNELDELRKMIEQSVADEPKRGPGRPRKVQEEAA